MSAHVNKKSLVSEDGEDIDVSAGEVAQEDSDEVSDTSAATTEASGMLADDDISGASEVPDVSEAMNDALFKAMFNYMLSAAQATQAGHALVVTHDAAEALQQWIWEHLWLPRMGWAEEETDPSFAAQPLV